MRGLGDRWPLHRIDAEGRPRSVGVLRAVAGGRWLLDADPPAPAWLRKGFADGLFPGLPWFLDELRPQGFMGHAFARAHAPELGLRSDLALWNDDDVLSALLLRGEDLPGDFVVGDLALERAQRLMLQAPGALPLRDRPSAYPELAAKALAGEIAGSSAGGEQPKFTATIAEGGRTRRTIVKFSDTFESPAGRRWADLLVCEHRSAELLRSRGVAGVESEILDLRGRRYLEVTRFDRVGPHGRRGFVSLLPLDAAHYGSREHWVDAADRLERDGWISPDDARTIRVLWWFGGLIANTDMHFANLAFFLMDELPLRLTPVYDMLPMLYRPAATGELVPRAFAPPLPPPRAQEAWQIAADLAREFWESISGDERVSGGFQAIALANGKCVAELRGRLA